MATTKKNSKKKSSSKNNNSVIAIIGLVLALAMIAMCFLPFITMKGTITGNSTSANGFDMIFNLFKDGPKSTDSESQAFAYGFKLLDATSSAALMVSIAGLVAVVAALALAVFYLLSLVGINAGMLKKILAAVVIVAAILTLVMAFVLAGKAPTILGFAKTTAGIGSYLFAGLGLFAGVPAFLAKK